jgi:hypothetical protein
LRERVVILATLAFAIGAATTSPIALADSASLARAAVAKFYAWYTPLAAHTAAHTAAPIAARSATRAGTSIPRSLPRYAQMSPCPQSRRMKSSASTWTPF